MAFLPQTSRIPHKTYITAIAFADEYKPPNRPTRLVLGCAPSSATRLLTQRIGVFQFPHHNLAEWRATDIVAGYRVMTFMKSA